MLLFICVLVLKRFEAELLISKILLHKKPNLKETENCVFGGDLFPIFCNVF